MCVCVKERERERSSERGEGRRELVEDYKDTRTVLKKKKPHQTFCEKLEPNIYYFSLEVSNDDKTSYKAYNHVHVHGLCTQCTITYMYTACVQCTIMYMYTACVHSVQSIDMYSGYS